MENFEQQSEQIISKKEEREGEDEIKKVEIEESLKKQWSEIMEENIDSFTEDIQEILKKRTGISETTTKERRVLYKARDEFWWEKFGMSHAIWNLQKKEWERGKNIIKGGAKREETKNNQEEAGMGDGVRGDIEKINAGKEIEEEQKGMEIKSKKQELLNVYVSKLQTREYLALRRDWLSLMKENIAEFSEEVQEILKKSKGEKTKISDHERKLLDIARNVFWEHMFGLNFDLADIAKKGESLREVSKRQKELQEHYRNFWANSAKKISEKLEKEGNELLGDVEKANIIEGYAGEKKELEESFKKKVPEIIKEYRNEFPEDIQEILKRRMPISEISDKERDKLDKALDEVWLKKLDMTLSEWREKRKKWQEANKCEVEQLKKDGIIEQKQKKLEDGLGKLNTVLIAISEKLKKENILVEDDCRIDMDYFKNLYGDEVKKDKNKIGYAKRMNRFGVGGELNIIGEKLEIIKTILFNKFLGEKFIIVRSSFYDDFLNGVDNIVIEKETGNLVCMFDEATKNTRSSKKHKKVMKINRKGGARLKYGLELRKDNETNKLSFNPIAVNNIPIFALLLKTEDVLKLEKEIISHPIDEISDYENKMFRYLIASVIPQMQLLEGEDLKPELREKINNFKKVIERI